MNYNWNWGIFFQDVGPNGVHTYLETLLLRHRLDLSATREDRDPGRAQCRL